MLKTVIVYICVETMVKKVLKNSFEEQQLFETETFCNIINVCAVTFDQCTAPLLNKSMNLI